MNTKHLNIWVPIHFSSHSNFLLYTEKCEKIAAIAIIFLEFITKSCRQKKCHVDHTRESQRVLLPVFVECMVSAEKT